MYFLSNEEGRDRSLAWLSGRLGMLAVLLWLALFPLAHAQSPSSQAKENAGFVSPGIESTELVRLLALDPVREVAVFEDRHGRLLTVFRGQALPGSNERLTRVFADSVELSLQKEQPLIYFLKVGENLTDRRAESLQAITSKNPPIQQVTVTSGSPIPETERVNAPLSRP